MEVQLGKSSNTTNYSLGGTLSKPRAITRLDGKSVMVLDGQTDSETGSNLFRVEYDKLGIQPEGKCPASSRGPLSITRGANFLFVGHELGAYMIPYGERTKTTTTTCLL